jgi:hypothetical protein
MTEEEQVDVKAKIEKLTAEFGKKVSQLEGKVAQLEGEVARKNQALGDFLKENEALRNELGGRSGTAARETVEQKIQRWKKEAR